MDYLKKTNLFSTHDTEITLFFLLFMALAQLEHIGQCQVILRIQSSFLSNLNEHLPDKTTAGAEEVQLIPTAKL